MSVTLHAESAEAFVHELKVLLAGVAGIAAANQTLPTAPVVPDRAADTAVHLSPEPVAVASSPEPAETKPKTRRKKADADAAPDVLSAIAEVEPEIVATVVEDHDDGLPASDDVGSTPVLTRDDAAAALRSLAATGAHGALKSRDVIYGIGAKRISDIPDDKFAAVVAEAKRWHAVIDAMSAAEREAANAAASKAGA